MKIKVLTMGLLGLALAGCGHVELVGHTMSAREWGDPTVFEALKEQRPVGSPFTQALARNYTELAVQQKEEGDLRNYEVFARKALLSAQGVVVDPELPDRWDLDKLNYAPRAVTVSYAEAYQWRTRLVNALFKCTRNRAPEAAAKAQVSYDNLIEDLEEGWEKTEIEATRAAFLEAVEQTEQSCPPMELPSSYVFFFDTNKSTIRKADMPIIKEIARQINLSNQNIVRNSNTGDRVVKAVHIIGWADTRASQSYNQKLSERRAESARTALIAAGVNPNDIQVTANGETRLPYPTKDGVNQIRNRTDHVIMYVTPVPPLPFTPAPAE
ncbi:MAG: OmpA family protein [Rhodospirillaceae bacterium]